MEMGIEMRDFEGGWGGTGFEIISSWEWIGC